MPVGELINEPRRYHHECIEFGCLDMLVVQKLNATEYLVISLRIDTVMQGGRVSVLNESLKFTILFFM